MKIKCRYTATVTVLAGFQKEQPQLEILGAHPLIDAPISVLANLIPSYVQGRMSELETRIFFIAWLKKSELVEFDAPAVPSMVTISKNMELLIKTVNWTSEKENRQLYNLPRYVVRRSNDRIANIRLWLNEWNECRFNWRSKQDQAIERTAFLLREELLTKLIRSSYKNMDNYRGRIANWALEASNAPQGLRDKWFKLFKLKEPELYNASADDLKELLQHMEQELDALSTTGGATLKLLRNLLLKHRRGILWDLELFDEDEEAELLGKSAAIPYTIISQTEKLEIEAARGAPEREPVASTYRSKSEYIVAKAKWNIMQRLKENAAKREQEAPTEEVLFERNKEDDALAAISLDPDEYISGSEDYDVKKLLESEAFRQQRTAEVGSFSGSPSGKEEEI